jgi:hypothetical protein
MTAKKKTPAKKPAAKKASVITLASIIDGTKMTPRVARRKLRNADFKKANPRWVFNSTEATAAKKVLGL